MLTTPERFDEPRPPGRERGAATGLTGVVAWLAGGVVLLVVGAAAVLFASRGANAWRRYGLDLLTESRWRPDDRIVGIAAAIAGSMQVAVIAVAIGVPLAIGAALYVTEYAPVWLRSIATTVAHVLAVVPSVIYGAWALVMLQPRAVDLARWLSQHLGWIPLFKADTDPNAANWQRAGFSASLLVVGLAVAAMVIPIACSMLIDAFGSTSAAERDAGFALGATRAGVIRSVVLPANRRAIAGAGFVAAGRALGEAVVVAFLVGPVFDLHLSVVTSGTTTMPALILDRFGDSTGSQRSVLYAAGFVLLVLTLAVGSTAAAYTDPEPEP